MFWGYVCIFILLIYLGIWIIPWYIYLDVWRWGRQHTKIVILFFIIIITGIVNWKFIRMIGFKLKGMDRRTYLFMIPLIYIILWISMYRRKKQDITVLEIKKCYYILVLIIDICIINGVKFNTFHINNFLGVPDELFISGIISIIVFVVALILDMLILSGATIKEINFAGATFVKEDIKKNIEENASNIQVLIEKIDAEHEVLQRFEDYMLESDVIVKLVEDFDTFNWGEEFRSLAQLYCEIQKKGITAEYIELKGDINLNGRSELKKELVIRYDFSNLKSERICRSVSANKSFFISGEEEFLFIPYESTYYVSPIIIVLRGQKDIFEIEQRFILNIFKRFEDYIMPIIAELPEE